MDQFEYDEIQEKAYDHVLMKRLLKYARPYWLLIILSIGLLLLMTAGDLARPYIIRLAIDKHINANGRHYQVFDRKIDLEGFEYRDKYWVRDSSDQDLESYKDEATLYTLIQYQKKTFTIKGVLPELDEDGYLIEHRPDSDTYVLLASDIEMEAKLVPKESVSLFRQEDTRGLINLAILALALAAFVFILNFIQVMILQYTGQKIIYDLRQDIFSHLQRLSLSFFDKNPIGRLVTRVTNDTETLNEMYTSVLVNLFKDIFMLVGIVIVMLRINSKLALISMATLPIIIIVSIFFRIYARKAYRLVRTQLSRINSFLSEHISGMRIIQIFNRENSKNKEFDEANTGYYRATLQEMKVYAVFRPVTEFVFSMGLALLIWLGGGQYIKGALEFGILYAFVNYMQMFFQPINDLTEKYNIMQSAMASAEKIFYLLDQDALIPDAENPVKVDRLQGKISFENVWFAYVEDEWVLKDISFTIEPGETVAFVGATGAGKSSIINLMSRFYEIQKGCIKIDGIPIDQIKKDDLRRNIGVVLQDVFLFTGDIEYNIRLNNEQISSERVKEISSFVNANKFIEKLPQSYKEKVMERGSTLSAGQRQLLAFARALAFDPAILVLDEATANIDTETEALIQDALKKLVKGRTTIAIAHRLSTIQHADKIILLHKGRIREVGSHQELLAKKGLYHQLYQLQYKG